MRYEEAILTSNFMEVKEHEIDSALEEQSTPKLTMLVPFQLLAIARRLLTINL